MVSELKLGVLVCGVLAATTMVGQTAAPVTPAAPAAKQQPLTLQSLDPSTRADPFPPVNPKLFTADTPTVATVDSYLKALLGYDPNRIWRVEAIEKTTAPGVSRVVVYVSDRVAANAKVQTAVFFVLPDGKHSIADSSGVNPFGERPFAESRALVQARADGPYHGVAAKDLEMVEYVDLQSTNTKAADPVMKRLVEDFPNAHIVVEPLPVTGTHPFAYQAAAFGACMAKVSNQAYFAYQQAVLDTQGGLTADAADKTLRAAVTLAGQDPTGIAACATGDPAKAMVDGSVKLAADLGVADTPALVVNGRVLPLNAPYETLKQIILYQAGLDGASAAAVGPASRGLIPRQ